MVFRRVTGVAGLALTAAAIGFVTLASAEPGSFHGPLARFVRETLSNLHPALELSKAQFGFAANVVMFVPLGFFLALVLPRGKIGLAFAAAPMVSAVIESVQFFLPTRGTQFEDVLANSVGGWIGTALAWGLTLLVAFAGGSRHPSGHRAPAVQATTR